MEPAPERVATEPDSARHLALVPGERYDVTRAAAPASVEWIELQSSGSDSLRGVDAWEWLQADCRRHGAIFEVDYERLAEWRPELPADIDTLLRLFDGQRTVLEVVARCEFADLGLFEVIARLRAESLLRPAPDDPPLKERPLSEAPASEESASEESASEDLASEESASEDVASQDRESERSVHRFRTRRPEGARSQRRTRAVTISAAVGLAAIVAGLWLVGRERLSSASKMRAKRTVVTAPIAAAVAAPVEPAPFAEPAPATEAEYERLVREGLKLESRGRSRAAAASFREALALRPEGPEALCGIAFALFEMGEVDAAERHAAKLIAIDPQSARAHLLRGAIAQDERRTHEARSEYRRYLELSPSGEYADEVRAVLSHLE